MELFEKTIESETIYDGRILRLCRDKVELENGCEAMREVVHHNGGVAVLAIGADGKIFLVKQFRYPYGEAIYEIPAGKLERGEDPLACAKRELREETGVLAKEWEFIGNLYPSPGYTDEVIYLYLARSLTESVQQLDEDEFLKVRRIAFDEALRSVLSGQIKDAKTQIALLKYSESFAQRPAPVPTGKHAAPPPLAASAPLVQKKKRIKKGPHRELTLTDKIAKLFKYF